MTKYFIFIPNLLSIIRIALVYPILNNVYLGNFKLSILFFIFAAITDALDGFLARSMNWQTYLGTIFIFWINSLIPFYIFIIFISRDIAILIGAAIQMSLIETNTPLPNFLGKLTTTLQIIYISIIFLKEIFILNINIDILNIFIIFITLLSLFVYAFNWLKDLRTYHNE